MSLEALAALLGHKSLSMTLVYARIADRTVAEEYFAVTERVEALYDQPMALPAEAEGTEMAKLRREMDRRMLGNGYCARPVELDCHFESICESCTFFVTTSSSSPHCSANATTQPPRASWAGSASSRNCSTVSTATSPRGAYVFLRHNGVIIDGLTTSPRNEKECEQVWLGSTPGPCVLHQ